VTALEEYESETRDPLYPEVEDPAPYVRQDVADAAIESLLDEVARLRCCGNCEHFSSSLYACELWPGHDKDAPESCHFTPSRWKEGRMTVDRRSLAELRATIERRDKRIAALEAELERQKQTTVWTLDRAEQAEAALAAEREKKCDNCYHDEYPRVCGKTIGWFQWDSDKSMTESSEAITYCNRYAARSAPEEET